MEDDKIPEMNRKQVETEMQGLIIHKDDVLKRVKSLIENKSLGPDMLEPFYLKELANKLCEPLCRIYCGISASLSTSINLVSSSIGSL